MTRANGPGDTEPVPPETSQRLRRFNVAMGLIHAAQATIIVLLTNEFSLPVTTSFLSTDPAALVDPVTPDVWFEVRFGWAVAAFLGLSAAAHLLVAGPCFTWYERQLEHRVNAARWIEYSLSSSLMIVLIAMLTGVFDAVALFAVAAVNACMILFGWVFERASSPGRPDWLPYGFGVFAGAVPWIAITFMIIGAGDVPTFVYAIYGSLFLFFSCFALVPVLQYREVGRWRNYLVGELSFIVLSLVAKSALAWQIFAGTLR